MLTTGWAHGEPISVHRREQRWRALVSVASVALVLIASSNLSAHESSGGDQSGRTTWSTHLERLSGALQQDTWTAETVCEDGNVTGFTGEEDSVSVWIEAHHPIQRRGCDVGYELDCLIDLDERDWNERLSLSELCYRILLLKNERLLVHTALLCNPRRSLFVLLC